MCNIVDFNVVQYDSCLSDNHSAFSMVLLLGRTCYSNLTDVQDEENVGLDDKENHDSNDFQSRSLK